jgi:hypothetical protein
VQVPLLRLGGREVTSSRYQELYKCWRDEHGCAIVDSNTSWEGERYTETLLNGDSLIMGGMQIPLSTQFLLCKEHEPKMSAHVYNPPTGDGNHVPCRECGGTWSAEQHHEYDVFGNCTKCPFLHKLEEVT